MSLVKYLNPNHPYEHPRPNRCPCKVCVCGWISIPDWEQGKYVWVECSDDEHKKEEVIVRNRVY